jgi:hypothetical protein
VLSGFVISTLNGLFSAFKIAGTDKDDDTIQTERLYTGFYRGPTMSFRLMAKELVE